jgi:hypothetical protein
MSDIDLQQLEAINFLKTVESCVWLINDKTNPNNIFTTANVSLEDLTVIEIQHNNLVNFLSQDIVVNHTPTSYDMSYFYTGMATAQTYINLVRNTTNPNVANIALI